MMDSTIIIVASSVQTVALALIAAAMKVWSDRQDAHHIATQASIEVVRQEVDGKMEKLLQVTGENEKAKGIAQGHTEEKNHPS